MLSRIAPPRSASITISAARAGACATWSHSSALNSLLVVMRVTLPERHGQKRCEHRCDQKPVDGTGIEGKWRGRRSGLEAARLAHDPLEDSVEHLLRALAG